MLLGVILVDVLTELPQAFMYLVNKTRSEDQPDLFSTAPRVLRYINTSVNVFIYMGLSRNFRSTFKDIYCTRPMNCWKEMVSGSESPQTNDIEENRMCEGGANGGANGRHTLEGVDEAAFVVGFI